MFCTSCGSEINDAAAVCVKCGIKVYSEKKFCPNCGNAITEKQSLCTSCGCELASFFEQKEMPKKGALHAKNKTTFLLLGIFLGSLGIHNFYAGYNTKGIIQLAITLVSCGFLSWIVWIWAVIEVCTVTADADGIPME